MRSASRSNHEGAYGRLHAFWCLPTWALALALTGCDAVPAAPIANAASDIPACAMPADAETVAVRFAIDGDTVKLTDGRSLRLIGLNALETGKHGATDEPFAHEATVRLGELLRQGTVRAVPGAERFDRYGRTLADLYSADGRLIAATLVGEGLALTSAVAPNLRMVDCVATAEREAHAARRGLWADPAAWTLPVGDAPADLRGFARVTGTVTEVHPKRGGTAVVLEGRMELWFPDLPGDPLRDARARAVPGARLAARGWWGSYRGRPNLKVDHPALIEFVD